VSEIKAEGAVGMVEKNGRPGADQFKIVAEQIRAAAQQIKIDQLKTGVQEPLPDHSSIALNQAFAQARGPAAAVRTATSAQSPEVVTPAPKPSAASLFRPDANNPSNGTDSASANSTVKLISAISEQPVHARANRQLSPSVVDLSSTAAEAADDRRPLGTSDTVIGTSVMLPQEASAARVGEAFPEDLKLEAAVNFASRNPEATEPSLGMYLLASREKRAVTREAAARATRIPTHYLRMMESNDYSMIADQLYLLPFLRRYAEYLGLDSEDIAIRFVREVQRSENSPGPAVSGNALDMERSPSNLWAILGALAVVALIAGSMLLHQHHHAADETADINVRQQDALPNENSGPPMRESVQMKSQDRMEASVPAVEPASASVAVAQSRMAARVDASAPRSIKVQAADEPIPPPGGTE